MNIGELENLSTAEIEDRLDKLPVGYISKKMIEGREYCYYQWRENEKVKRVQCQAALAVFLLCISKYLIQ